MEDLDSVQPSLRQVPVDLETVNLLRAEVAKYWDVKKRAAPRSHAGNAWAVRLLLSAGIFMAIAISVFVVGVWFRLALSTISLILLALALALVLAAFLAQMIANTASVLSVKGKGDTNIRWMREYSEFDVSFVNAVGRYGVAEVALVLHQFQQNLWDTYWRALGIAMMAIMLSVCLVFVDPSFFFSVQGSFYDVLVGFLPLLLVYALVFERMSRLREVCTLLQLAVTLRI